MPESKELSPKPKRRKEITRMSDQDSTVLPPADLSEYANYSEEITDQPDELLERLESGEPLTEEETMALMMRLSHFFGMIRDILPDLSDKRSYQEKVVQIASFAASIGISLEGVWSLISYLRSEDAGHKVPLIGIESEAMAGVFFLSYLLTRFAHKKDISTWIQIITFLGVGDTISKFSNIPIDRVVLPVNMLVVAYGLSTFDNPWNAVAASAGSLVFQALTLPIPPDQQNFFYGSEIAIVAMAGLIAFSQRHAHKVSLDALEKANKQKDEINTRLAEANQLLAETNAKLEFAINEARTANHARSRFFANMSHELRTPLNAVIGYAEILLGGMAGEISETQKGLITHMHRNAKALLDIINDILDFSRMEAGEVKLALHAHSPYELIHDLIQQQKEGLQIRFNKRHLNIETTFHGDLEKPLITDKKRIHHIVTNLFTNAIKFTNEGGIHITVTRDEQNWQIIVADSGIGIPADKIATIFEPFKLGDDSDTRQHQGTGLGLALVEQSAKLLGGSVVVESEANKGTTFVVTMPVVEPTEEDLAKKGPKDASELK